ncbi:MAG: hypothetical protein QOE07_1756, partial [Acidimicrobiaceae bacterium]|nr:hypothetical protein [Acidimicrobiaceae bacterium]
MHNITSPVRLQFSRSEDTITAGR